MTTMTDSRRVRLLSTICIPAILLSSFAAAQEPTDGTSADAQDGAWLVPVWEPGAEGPSDAVLSAQQVVDAQLTAAGVAIASDDTMQRVFEERISSPATQLTQTEIDRWVSRSRSALRNLARADYDAARTDLLEAQQISQDAAEELNREATGARNVLDTCLYMVRAFLEQGDRVAAERQTRQCRQQVPNVQPSELQHTPEVVELLANTVPAVTGRLHVTSEPSGCAVRINGVWNGETPFEIDRLQHGQYRLQVECDPSIRGRVRRIEIGDERLRVHVTAAFDAAFASRPVHGLEGSADFGARLAEEVDRTLFVLSESNGVVELHRFVPGANPTVVRAPPAKLPEAVAALREGQSLDFTVSPPRVIETLAVAQVGEDLLEVEPSAPPPGALPKYRLILGLGLMAAGAASVALAVIPHRSRHDAGNGEPETGFGGYAIAEPGDLDFLARQQRWKSFRPGLLAASFVGGAAFAVGSSLLVREQPRVPWYAWVGGGVGVGVGAFALIHYLSASSCDGVETRAERQGCVDRGQAGGRAAMLGAAALPLVAWPIAALLRRSDIDLSVSAGPESAALTLRGEF